MASYLNQPDGSSACCDCPDRAGPCDDCVAGCTHSIAFQINVDSGASGIIGDIIDLYCADSSDLSDLTSGDVQIGLYADVDAGQWSLYPGSLNFSTITVTTPVLTDAWNTVSIRVSTPQPEGDTDNCATISLTVNGVTESIGASGFSGQGDSLGNIVVVGAGGPAGFEGGNCNYSIRNIAFTGDASADPAEDSFSYPAASFGYNDPGITFPGGGVVRVDSSTGEYAAAALSVSWKMCCLCPPLSTTLGFVFSGSGSVPSPHDCDWTIAPISAGPTSSCFPLSSGCNCVNDDFTDTRTDPNDGTSCDFHQSGRVYSNALSIVHPTCSGTCGATAVNSNVQCQAHLTRDSSGYHVQFHIFGTGSYCGGVVLLTDNPATGVTQTEDLGDDPTGAHTFTYNITATDGSSTPVGTLTVAISFDVEWA